MKLVPGLGLSAALIFSFSMALADDDQGRVNSRSAQAVQVYIDKDTGRKTVPDDSAESAATTAAQSFSATVTSGIMPASNQALQQHADGTLSFRLGTESMRFMVLAIGEDGQRTIEHQSLAEFENRDAEPSPDEGDE